jgi:hypothetical protein
MNRVIACGVVASNSKLSHSCSQTNDPLRNFKSQDRLGAFVYEIISSVIVRKGTEMNSSVLEVRQRNWRFFLDVVTRQCTSIYEYHSQNDSGSHRM